MACSVRNWAFFNHLLVHLGLDFASSLQLLQRGPVGDLISTSLHESHAKRKFLTLLLLTAKLLHVWGDVLSPHEIAEKVKRFFWFYSINRHKSKFFCPRLLEK